MNQKGQTDPLLLPFIVAVIAVIGLAGFGVWSYSGFTEQRDETQALIDTALAANEESIRAELQAEFDNEAKNPYRTFTSSATLGSVNLTYPKTWSGYIVQNDSASTPLNAYFHPDFVRDTRDDSARALRISVVDSPYSSELNDYSRRISDGTLTSRAIEVSSQVGVRLDGIVSNGLSGIMVLLPVRDKTLYVWTEGESFIDDFESIVLPNLSFTP